MFHACARRRSRATKKIREMLDSDDDESEQRRSAETRRHDVYKAFTFWEHILRSISPLVLGLGMSPLRGSKGSAVCMQPG